MADDPHKPAPPPPPPPKKAAAPPPPPAAAPPTADPPPPEAPPETPPEASSEAAPEERPAAPPAAPPAQPAAPEPAPAAPPATDERAAIPGDFQPSAPLESPMTDAEERRTLSKISRHTTPFGRIATVLLIGGALVLGGLWYWQERQYEEMEAKLDAIAEMDDVEQIKSDLRAMLPETSEQDLKWRIVKNMGHFKDEQAMPLLIEELDNGGRVRRAAAWAIAQIGPPAADAAKPKLLEVLPKTDERDRAQVVWTLALLRTTEASDAILEAFSQGMLQSLEGFDPKIIADVLGPDQLASDKLINHPEESVRVLTAHALAESRDAEVIDPLTKLLRAELDRPEKERSKEVIRAAASGLGRTGDPRAARPLFEALQKLSTRRQGIIDALSKSTGAKDLAVLVREAKETEIKRDLVRLLAATRDPAAADPLANLLDSEDTEIRSTAAFALADLHDERAAPVLLELARSEEASVQDKAIGRLRNVASPEISDDLVELLEDVPHRKADVLAALGATGDTSVARHIESELDGDDGPTAAMALAKLEYEPGYNKLVKKISRPKDVEMSAKNPAERKLSNEDLLRTRKAAITAVGLYGREEVADDLMTIVEDPLDDFELRRLAAESLGQIGTADVLSEVVDKMGDASLDADVRRYYVQALWQRPVPELGPRLIELIKNDDAPVSVRRAAAVAVGYIGSPDHDAALTEMVKDDDLARYAALAITLGGGETAVEELLAVLDDNADVREILQMHLMDDEQDRFNVLTEDMFESGQVWRRLEAGHILKDGDPKNSFSYAWAKVTDVLRRGWDGPGGVSAKETREKLYEALTGEDPERRSLVARALMDMGERGLLLRARDQGGVGADAAREVLLIETE